MKILVFSDTHLTKKFDARKYQFLENLIRDADQVIINGDFWDSWFLTFDEFLDSWWSSLFPLLKEKKTIYIYGNHDMKSVCDDRVNMFCDKAAESYELEIGTEKYLLVHGDRIGTPAKDRGPMLRMYSRVLNDKKHLRLNKAFKESIHWLEMVGYLTLGKYIRFNAINMRANNEMSQYSRDNIEGVWLIAGDSHRPEEDQASHYLNSGYINYGFGSYVMVDEAGARLAEQKY